jgi:hypothetical protein
MQDQGLPQEPYCFALISIEQHEALPFLLFLQHSHWPAASHVVSPKQSFALAEFELIHIEECLLEKKGAPVLEALVVS